jgi:hypothetical protein
MMEKNQEKKKTEKIYIYKRKRQEILENERK